MNEGKMNTYKVSIETGPTAADVERIEVKAMSSEEAVKKAEAYAKKNHLRSPMINTPILVKEGKVSKALGALAVAGAVAGGIVASPKADVDGQTYDLASDSAPANAKKAKAMINGKKKDIKIWSAHTPRGGSRHVYAVDEAVAGPFKKFKKGQIVTVKKTGEKVEVLRQDDIGLVQTASKDALKVPDDKRLKIVPAKGYKQYMPSELQESVLTFKQFLEESHTFNDDDFYLVDTETKTVIKNLGSRDGYQPKEGQAVLRGMKARHQGYTEKKMNEGRAYDDKKFYTCSDEGRVKGPYNTRAEAEAKCKDDKTLHVVTGKEVNNALD